MISVIIPTIWRETIWSSLESINLTLKNYEYEVVLIGQENNIFNELKRDYPVKLVVPPSNNSIGLKRKLGVENASYDTIAFLDDDDMWIVKYKKKQFEIFFSNDNDYKLSWGGIRLLKDGKHLMDRIEIPRNPRKEIWYYNFIPTSSIIVSKKLIEDVGNFDPRFKVMEDWDLNLRILMKDGVSLLPYNNIVVTYTINSNKRKLKEFAEAYELLFKKYDVFNKDKCVRSFHKIRQNFMMGNFIGALKYIYTPLICPHTIKTFIREFKNMLMFGR